MSQSTRSPVVVVGGGNAGLCAALAAHEAGASVILLEKKAPLAERVGNSFFTTGGFRFAHEGLEDLRLDTLTDRSLSTRMRQLCHEFSEEDLLPGRSNSGFQAELAG